jgi:hypothetical protein
MSSSSISVDLHENNESSECIFESTNDHKVRSTSLTTKKNDRRQSRIPRSMSNRISPVLANVAVAQGEDPLSTGGSSHSTRSRKSLDGMRNQRKRFTGNRRPSTGVSAGGGSKNRETVTDDDAWQIFREALSNMT